MASFELTPQKLVYGGDALGYHDGRPVFVSRVLPGERVEVEVVRVAKGAVHARPLRMIEASPDRIVPPCPYYGGCGGCHYQHISPPKQAEAKIAIFHETWRRIARIGGNNPITVHTGPAWNYRNQVQLKVARQPEGRPALGFFAPASHCLKEVDTCAILSPRLNALLAELRQPRWSQLIASSSEIELLTDEADQRVAVTLPAEFDHAAAVVMAGALLAEVPAVVRVAVGSGSQFRVFGDPRFQYGVGDFRYQVGPGCFFQVSRFLIPNLVAAATEAEAGALALDLFAGVGLFSLPLAQRFGQVVSVESNPLAVAALRENSAAHALGNIRAVTSATEDFLRRYAQGPPDLVVVDPPRAGLGAGTAKLLAGLRPKRIHYVSCSPPTLARDLALLIGHGYEVNSVELFDLFPQTYHLETLARLTRRSV